MDQNNTLRLTLVDWQWNAAVICFINIIGKDNVYLSGIRWNFRLSVGGSKKRILT